jgi:5-formyltetrahydrofolate cyclo-ligase
VTSSSTGRGKPDTRRTLLLRRDTLTDQERADKSAVIGERTAAYLAGRCEPGSVIALYAHKGSEVETTPLDVLLRAQGFRIAYPRVVEDTRRLAFSEVAIAELVESGRWGLREPAPAMPQVETAAIRAFVMPGLAFDRAGGRVGWGKGHYDATVGGTAALRVALAFDCQVIDSVPHEPHDAILDAIITETTTVIVGGEQE